AGPAIRWDERASRPDAEPVRGRDEVQGAMRGYLEGWREYAFELEDVAEVAPGAVAGICRERGIDPAGAPVDRRFGALWVVEGSKIVSWSTYATPREAVRAAKEQGWAAQRPTGEQPSPSRETAAAERETAATQASAATERTAAATEPESAATGGAEQAPASPQPQSILTDERRRRAAKARARLQRQRLAS
ncbi:MAG: nuclear transport factor 2 family protein, partial [Solirubrobacterales bacterium]